MPARSDRSRAQASRSSRPAHGAHARRRGARPWWQRLDDERPRPARRRALDHPGIVAVLLVTAIALPLAVVIERMETATALPDVVQVSSVKGPARSEPRIVPSPASTRPMTTLAPTTTASSTTTPPTTASTSATTTAAPPTSTASPSTTALPTTTPRVTAPPTTAAPPRLTAAPRPAAPAARAPVGQQNSETGEGTWYVYEPGGCANNTLPKGTRVTVTNLASGATTTCIVNDRGAFGPPRILDMDKRVFTQIADPSTGVIPIRISW